MAPKRVWVYFDIAIGTKTGGRIVFELFTDVTPKAAENFRGLCTGEYGLSGRTGKPLHYLGTSFFRSLPSVLIQGGDIQNNDGTGGECVWGGTFRDENFIRRHSQAGCLAMANNGRNTNGSQFYITLKKASALDNRHVVIGQVIEGMEVLRAMQLVPVEGKSNKPKVPIVVAACGELGAPPRRLDGLNATRMQLDEIMDKYVREETKKQEEAHKLVDSDAGEDSESSGSSENETAAHRRLRRRMKRKKQRYLKSALFKGEDLFKQLQQEAAHELKEKYAAEIQRFRGSDEEEDEDAEDSKERPDKAGEDGEEASGRTSPTDDSGGSEDGREEEDEEKKKKKRERRKGVSGRREGEQEEEEEGEEDKDDKEKKERAEKSSSKEVRGGAEEEEIDVLLSDLDQEEEEDEEPEEEKKSADAGTAEGVEKRKKEEEREKRLLRLRLKINQGRKLTNKEVLEEKRKWNDPLYEKKKAEACVRSLMRELHGGGGDEADDHRAQGDTKNNKKKIKDRSRGSRGGEEGVKSGGDESLDDEGDPGKDPRRAYLNEAAAMVLEKKTKEEKRSETKSFGWNVFNQDALYRAHKKRLAEVSFREDEYQKQKELLGGGQGFYDTTTAALALGDFRPSEAAKERLVESIENVQKRRKNFSRRRTFYEDDNVTYINERNRIYNEKIERAFGATSLEYKQNLERGTAL